MAALYRMFTPSLYKGKTAEQVEEWEDLADAFKTACAHFTQAPRDGLSPRFSKKALENEWQIVRTKVWRARNNKKKVKERETEREKEKERKCILPHPSGQGVRGRQQY